MKRERDTGETAVRTCSRPELSTPVGRNLARLCHPYLPLLHFLGVFPNAGGFKPDCYCISEPSPSGPVLVPQWLSLISFDGEGFLRALSELSGSLLFRYTNLLDVKGGHLLLNTYADTLEALRIYTTFVGIFYSRGPLTCLTRQSTESLRPPETLLLGL